MAKGRPWLQRDELRQAISAAVDRQAIVNTVYLGAAEPVSGPITPGHGDWYVPGLPNSTLDRARAGALLDRLGLIDRNGDGARDDAGGRTARIALLTQKGHTVRERTAAVIQEQLRQVGLTIDLVAVDVATLNQRIPAGDFDAFIRGVLYDTFEPATRLLVELGAVPHLEPGPEDAGDAVGGRDRSADGEAVHDHGSGGAAEDVRRGAADSGRAPAGDLFRGAEVDGAGLDAAERRGGLSARAAGALERGRADGGRGSAVTSGFAAYVLRRIAAAIAFVVVVSTGALVLARLAPGDAVSTFGRSPVEVEQERERLGLNRPMGALVADWLIGLATFDLGRSSIYSQPVAPIVWQRAVRTARTGGDRAQRRDDRWAADRCPHRRAAVRVAGGDGRADLQRTHRVPAAGGRCWPCSGWR